MSLSGRVDALETSVSFLVQDILQRPSLQTFSDYGLVWNQQFDTIEDKIIETREQLNNLQILYSNIVLGITGYSGTSSSGLSETFETINKNLKQYPYRLYYSGSYLTGVRYTISSTSFVNKSFSYDVDGILYRIQLSGNPLPSTSLNKYFYYSGEILTGVSYN